MRASSGESGSRSQIGSRSAAAAAAASGDHESTEMRARPSPVTNLGAYTLPTPPLNARQTSQSTHFHKFFQRAARQRNAPDSFHGSASAYHRRRCARERCLHPKRTHILIVTPPCQRRRETHARGRCHVYIYTNKQVVVASKANADVRDAHMHAPPACTPACLWKTASCLDSNGTFVRCYTLHVIRSVDRYQTRQRCVCIRNTQRERGNHDGVTEFSLPPDLDNELDDDGGYGFLVTSSGHTLSKRRTRSPPRVTRYVELYRACIVARSCTNRGQSTRDYTTCTRIHALHICAESQRGSRAHADTSAEQRHKCHKRASR
ncbi:hypothetical protein HPB50_024921 [Hyalomma asiaticum]|uniref:Uncharacterized protein n=1 Tax=Hyalomma asiaticum TaxID=266040 RepID=A0ACB7SQN8_HYAAI|nr:hypothetical protein HPB50_024921 [Hyalomma asiaticum]